LLKPIFLSFCQCVSPRIFDAFAQASANRGVDVQGQERLFTALGQIIGKRKLQAEEVKGQIGDIKGFGDFQSLIAQALGVSTPQLGKMMEQGEVGIDVLPKVAALLEAQNAAASETQTALQAQTKYNNSLVEFQTALGNLLQPLQKLGFNLLAQGLDFVTQKFGSLSKIILNLAAVGLLALFGKVNVITVAMTALGKVLHGLILTFSNLWAAKMAILAQALEFVAAYALVAAAIATVSNLIKLSKNHYQELNDNVDKLTASMNRYKDAVEAAKDAQNQLNNSKIDTPQLNEGWKLPDNWFGNFLRPIVGGDRLNLDNLVRKRIGLTTEAERRQADFQVATGDLNFRTDQLLMNDAPAINAAKEITEFDRQIAEIQSKRLELLPSDKKALEASLEEERKINSERDVQLKILTNYQQSLESSQTFTKQNLEALEQGYANGEFTTDVYESQKAALLDRQDSTADKLEEINPTDPALNATTSSGNSIYPGSAGSPSGGTQSDPYNVNSYKATGVSFSGSPPNETGSNITYRVASLFWAAGTLHLLVTTNNTSSAYRDRLVHYRLNLTSGWVFEYQAASSLLLRNYTVTITDISAPKIFETLTGTSQFFRANDSFAFGSGYTSLTNGLLRFEIKNDGSVDISFINNTAISPNTWIVPYAIYENRAYFSTTSGASLTLIGTFNGLVYYRVNTASNSGIPIPDTAPQADREYQYNIRVSSGLETGNIYKIYHGTETIFSYFPGQNSPPNFYLTTGSDGSYMIKALVRYLCETGVYACPTANRVDLVYFFFKEKYSSEPVLLDIQRWISGSTGGLSYYLQTSNAVFDACDRIGNMLVPFGNFLVYYKAGSGRGINIASQMGFTVSEIRNKPAVTPYGFAVIQHNSTNIFAVNAQINLAFVQYQVG
jgi:tape measure domain-containing protein